ncbi:MAG: ATPase [Thermoplasmata archaeon HGW-Thermoplasmata-2]|nr:MAG: ATPase [Thermoplasmata archaeon HGW-Thermoplasmata-2]
MDRSVFSTLQKYWDEKKDGTRMLLFCIGSYVGLMKRVFHDDKEPLYGRTTSQIRIDPMDYRNTRKILDDIGLKGEEEKITAYSIFGGVPKYYEILSMVGKKELGKTVIAAFLENGAPLAEEGNNLLVREFGGSYMTYFSILEAVSRGKCTLVEIADAIGFAPTTLGKYLFELANEYGVIVKRIPATEDEFKSKKGRYFLKDPLLKFWFEFIRKNKSAIEIGNFNVVLDQVEERIGSFIGKRYEDIVRELLIHYNNRKLKGFEISFEKMGSWWDRSGNEIDVCAFSKEKMLLGEVKWSNKMVDVDLAEALMEKSRLTGWKGRFGYLICSKAGFTERCRRFASDNDILLLDIGDLRNAFDALP